MSSQGSPTLDLDVRARRAEPRIAIVLLLTAGVSPWLLQIDVWQSAGLAICAGGVLWGTLRRAGWLGGPNSLVRVTWHSDRRWILTEASGAVIEAELQPDSRRGPGCAWLHWCVPGSERWMLLVRSDLAGAQMRRLLVRLGIDGTLIPVAIAFDGDDASVSSEGSQRAIAFLRRTKVRLAQWFHPASATIDTGGRRVASARQQ